MSRLKEKIKLPFKVIYNFLFCLKYPFYKARNVWTDKSCGYTFTLYDEIPEGWRKAFGKQLSKDLKKALVNAKQLKTFRFTQIKEKYGSLRLYCSGASDEVWNVINHYESISTKYCIKCGKPAVYETKGYISYLCEECFDKIEPYYNQDYKPSCKINKE